MSALSEALEHSQAKALTALFKAYTRREDGPDDVQVSFLLHAWRMIERGGEHYPERAYGVRYGR